MIAAPTPGPVNERPAMSGAPTPAPDTPRRGPLRRLYDWVLGWADTRFGTPALAVLSFIESSFFPIPPDPLLLALAVAKPKRSLTYATVCTIASVAGGLFGYWIGFALFDLIGQRILEFYGLNAHYETVKVRFQEYAFLSILGAAFTPIPYKVFTIAAGSFGLDLLTFTLASALGRGLRFFLEGFLIRWFGPSIRDFIDRYFNLLAIAFFILLIGGFVLVKVLMP